MTVALEKWLEECYDSAYRTACLLLKNPSDAEEAVQEAFLRAWKFRDALSSNESIKPWLYRVVINSCMSKLRYEIPKQQAQQSNFDLETLAGSLEHPEDQATKSELGTVMLAALSTLSDDLRIPLVLRYYSGLTENEIAIAIKRRPGTVKSRLHEGRRKLSVHPSLKHLAKEWISAPTYIEVTDINVSGDQAGGAPR